MVGRGRRGQQRDRRTVPGAADGAVPGPPTGPQLDHVRAGRRAVAALAEPASFTAPPVCRLYSMSRLGSAATAASVLTVFRECGVVRRRRSGPPADRYDQSQPVLLTGVCSGRRRAPWMILQADATVPPHRGGAGMTLPRACRFLRAASGLRSRGAVSVLVSVVLVCGHPGAFERSLRRRGRRSADQRGPRFADLESGLGASPRGFESRILRT